ncbi:nucleoside hydrolase [Sphingobacterium shayense]|uniref:nucleoside hydrolase n=1 Tax=Sphingobacterium shayense TaxID=626343 RepID=UPI0015536573|nr:nucleoside hydrolase [Sphingobacterium shayense]NQD70774.1 nucleoside hydrolase [Sphingobacterium shayense]
MEKNLLVLLSLLLVSCDVPTAKLESSQVDLILDTDIGPDYDDVGAMALMHALADSGEVNILATISSNMDENVIPCIEVINGYFKRPDIPVGVTKGKGVSLTTWHEGSKWPKFLAGNYAHPTAKTSEAPDAVAVYRKILSVAPDNSITICTVGFLTNLKNLLQSKADEYSDLDGLELVKRKVRLLVSMAGEFPASKEGEFNVKKDAVAAAYVVDSWPTEIVFSGFEIGNTVLTGKATAEMPVHKSPIKDAYSLSLAQDNPHGRSSWDQTAVLVAIKGYRPFYDIKRGTMQINEKTGANSWIEDEAGRHAYLIKRATDEEMASKIETYMMHQPVAK